MQTDQCFPALSIFTTSFCCFSLLCCKAEPAGFAVRLTVGTLLRKTTSSYSGTSPRCHTSPARADRPFPITHPNLGHPGVASPLPVPPHPELKSISCMTAQRDFPCHGKPQQAEQPLSCFFLAFPIHESLQGQVG